MVNFKENYHFQGLAFSSGVGVHLFPGGGGGPIAYSL